MHTADAGYERRQRTDDRGKAGQEDRFMAMFGIKGFSLLDMLWFDEFRIIPQDSVPEFFADHVIAGVT